MCAQAADAREYMKPEALGLALMSERPRVVMIDEADKAPRVPPNDLHGDLERGDLAIQEIPDKISGAELNREMVHLAGAAVIAAVVDFRKPRFLARASGITTR